MAPASAGPCPPCLAGGAHGGGSPSTQSLPRRVPEREGFHPIPPMSLTSSTEPDRGLPLWAGAGADRMGQGLEPRGRPASGGERHPPLTQGDLPGPGNTSVTKQLPLFSRRTTLLQELIKSSGQKYICSFPHHVTGTSDTTVGTEKRKPGLVFLRLGHLPIGRAAEPFLGKCCDLPEPQFPHL